MDDQGRVSRLSPKGVPCTKAVRVFETVRQKIGRHRDIIEQQGWSTDLKWWGGNWPTPGAVCGGDEGAV